MWEISHVVTISAADKKNLGADSFQVHRAWYQVLLFWKLKVKFSFLLKILTEPTLTELPRNCSSSSGQLPPRCTARACQCLSAISNTVISFELFTHTHTPIYWNLLWKIGRFWVSWIWITEFIPKIVVGVWDCSQENAGKGNLINWAHLVCCVRGCTNPFSYYNIVYPHSMHICLGGGLTRGCRS